MNKLICTRTYIQYLEEYFDPQLLFIQLTLHIINSLMLARSVCNFNLNLKHTSAKTSKHIEKIIIFSLKSQLKCVKRRPDTVDHLP